MKMTEYRLAWGSGLEFRAYLSVENARKAAFKRLESGNEKFVWVYRMDKDAIAHPVGRIDKEKRGMYWSPFKGKGIVYIALPNGKIARV